MQRLVILFILLLGIYSACFAQSQGDVWERNPEYEVLPDGSIYIGGTRYTEEEQAEIESYNNSDDSYYSYSILGSRTSASELFRSGYTKVGADTWTFFVADNIDGYIWLEDYVIVSEGFVFHDINPFLNHDDIADMVADLFENGHIRKITKCRNANDGSICMDLKNANDNNGSLISFPVTVFKTDLSYVKCYLTQSKVFSNGKEKQFLYICSLGL